MICTYMVISSLLYTGVAFDGFLTFDGAVICFAAIALDCSGFFLEVTEVFSYSGASFQSAGSATAFNSGCVE